MDLFRSLFSSAPAPSPSTTSTSPQSISAPQSQTEPTLPADSSDSTKRASPSISPITNPQTTISPPKNKAHVIFTAGLAFSALSVLITRRSFARRRIRQLAQTQSASTIQKAGMLPGTGIELTQPVAAPNVNPSMEALEALNIATINVISFSMLAAGSALWYLDIGSLDDARKKLRGGLGYDGSGKTEEEAEEEMEEWLAEVLKRKEEKTRRGQKGKGS